MGKGKVAVPQGCLCENPARCMRAPLVVMAHTSWPHATTLNTYKQASLHKQASKQAWYHTHTHTAVQHVGNTSGTRSMYLTPYKR